MSDADRVYERLKMYKGDSSWAIWSIPEDLNSKKDISDLEVFKNEKMLIRATRECKYVFVGLNPSNQTQCHECKNKEGCVYKEEVSKKKKQPWYNFHSACTLKSQDYKLRKALHGTKYWGSFITDIEPHIIETDSRKVSTIPTNKAKEKVENIIDLMGENIVFVAMGNKACSILKKLVPEGVDLKKITHYSTYIEPQDYKDRVLEELSKDPISERIKCRKIVGDC